MFEFHDDMPVSRQEQFYLLMLIGLLESFENNAISSTDLCVWGLRNQTQYYFDKATQNPRLRLLAERAADIQTFCRCFPNLLEDYVERLKIDAMNELKNHYYYPTEYTHEGYELIVPMICFVDKKA